MEENTALESLKKHPSWKQAVDKVLERFDEEGYGCFISDKEIDSYLSLTHLDKKSMTGEELMQYQTKRLQIYRSLRKLLCEHDLYLKSVRKPKGFIILHPNDQISIGHKHQHLVLRRQLLKAEEILIHIHQELLDPDILDERNRNLFKLSLAKRGLNKRKLEIVYDKKKLIEDKKTKEE